ncbi:MAG: hypothetical protein K6A89_08210 [Treponema sp.]|nr:hypothetical protein [Treponema sp.]
MINFKKIIIALLIISGTSFCSAAQISFQVVQHDESAKDVTEQSYIIEDSLLTGFFENGYIVTNSPASIASTSGDDLKLFNTGVGEASQGYSDYFVQIRLYYGKAQSPSANYSELQKVEWDAVNTKNGNKIAADSIKDLSVGIKEKDLKKVSSDLILEIFNALKTKK